MSRAERVELSIIVPMFNEEEVLRAFFSRLLPILETAVSSYEVICVNDGSSDRSLELLLELREENQSIKIIDLARNFGKELAMSAGIDHARGEAAVPIDVDLQDPPEVITDLVNKWREGYDVVLAVRKDRSSDSFFKRVSAALFYRAISAISDTAIPKNVGDFRLISRPVIQAIRQLPERTRFMKGIFAWVGFRQTTIFYTRPERAAGETKWRAWRLWNFALEGIVSFSSVPLKVWSYVGVLSALLALLYMIYIVIRTMVYGVDVPGYASLITIQLFFNGMILISLGVLGEYLARIFLEVKQRPLYLVQDKWGFDQDLD
jgi:glycosyltransferase involved in cell wall biosynthesis